MLDIIVTLRGGMRTVFSDRVRDYELLTVRGARTIRFALHCSYCSGQGNPPCFKTHRITTQRIQIQDVGLNALKRIHYKIYDAVCHAEGG